MNEFSDLLLNRKRISLQNAYSTRSKGWNWSQRKHNGVISWGFNPLRVWTQDKKIHGTQAIALCIPLLIVSNKLLLLLINHNALLLSPEIPPYNTSQRHQLPIPTWVGIKLFTILGFAIDLPEFVGLIATVRVQVSHDEGWWAATIIQIHNTSSRILSLILHLKKNLQFFVALEDCCRPCILCVGNCGTGSTGRSSDLQMGTVNPTVWTCIRLVHVETFTFLTNFKSVYMKSVHYSVDRRMT